MMGAVLIPSNLRSHSRGERSTWLERLPAVLAEVAGRWQLQVLHPYEPGGQTSWVAPALRADGSPAVLKLLWPHFEADHEADALCEWAGRGAVQLYDEWDLGHTRALLLEKCAPGSALSQLPEPEQDEVLAGLLPRLWVKPAAGHRFRHLSSMAAEWVVGFRLALASGGQPHLNAELIDLGLSLFESLAAPTDGDVLLATDLHAGNVLRAQREPWLAIDPKPYVGDPAYDAMQHLVNCRRMFEDPGGVTRRFAEMLDVDADRTMGWLMARCVVESLTWPEGIGVARALASELDR